MAERRMIKILIVDDEKSICDLIDINLSAAGYQCRTVQDGLKAIDIIESERFDLILLDIMLPGVDGYDIMEYIRPLKIPVIFITAKHEVKDRVKGLKLGAEDYLVKPFDVVELVARVEVVLRRYNKTEGTSLWIWMPERSQGRGGRWCLPIRNMDCWYCLSAIRI